MLIINNILILHQANVKFLDDPFDVRQLFDFLSQLIDGPNSGPFYSEFNFSDPLHGPVCGNLVVDYVLIVHAACTMQFIVFWVS
jgi:hypothetical protein